MNRLLCAFIFGLFIIECRALSCRSEKGRKDADLKKIYNTCLKQQENNSDNHYSGQERRDREYWNRDNGHREDRERNSGNRERYRGYDKNRDDRETSDISDRYNYMDRRDGDTERNNNRNDRDRHMMTNFDQQTRNSHISGRNDFLQNEDYGESGQNHYNSYNRRNKRERRVEMNSGQRSQYNPNSQKNGSDSAAESKSSNNSSKEQDKACALHCLMENLQMTGENGMPDRYLVTHAITKDVKNEDLKDFLQESIEECFQILDNENTEDKCEFSKNLLLCLSEKGRANCDDWKDEFQF